MAYSDDMIARIIVEANYHGDDATCNKYDVTVRTLQRWRKRLDTDDKLSQNVALKKDAFDRDWVEDAPATLKAGMNFIKRAAQEGNPKNPDHVHAVAGGMKIVSEIMAVDKYLDAKLNHTAT